MYAAQWIKLDQMINWCKTKGVCLPPAPHQTVDRQ